MDGVPDYLDKCPGTPAGVKVDKDGCPLDSDGDGVPDYLDKCPDTPRGVQVDKDGCPPPVVKKEAPVPPMEKTIVEKGRVTLNVEFDFDKAVIKKKYHIVLNLVCLTRRYFQQALLPVIHKSSTSTKMRHFNQLSMMLFYQQF